MFLEEAMVDYNCEQTPLDVNMMFMEEMIICGYLAMATHKEFPVSLLYVE